RDGHARGDRLLSKRGRSIDAGTLADRRAVDSIQDPIPAPVRQATLVFSAYAVSQFDDTRRSPVVTLTLHIAAPMTPPPIFVPLAGTYGAPQEVTLTSAFADAAIHYTTDGTLPTTASPLYTGPMTFAAGPPTMLKAMAIAPGAIASDAVTSWYLIDPAYD